MKKGSNGIDYEYEYVYYYYDDDSDDVPKKDTDEKVIVPVSDDKPNVNQNSGKNRYDKSTTTAVPVPDGDRNELPAARGKGRQSIPVTEDNNEEPAEERLPVNTRFPPRTANTPSVQIVSNIDETTKRTSIKRPSLELVDSQSFNRGDKGQTKSRGFDTGFGKTNDIRLGENAYTASVATESLPYLPAISEATTITSNDNEESTTQTMDKVALDLYAHLVNENSNIDANVQSSQLDFSTPDYLVRTNTGHCTVRLPIATHNISPPIR